MSQTPTSNPNMLSVCLFYDENVSTHVHKTRYNSLQDLNFLRNINKTASCLDGVTKLGGLVVLFTRLIQILNNYAVFKIIMLHF